MRRGGATFLALAACLGFSAVIFDSSWASDQKVRSVSPGNEIRLAVLGSLKQDCTSNPAPKVRLEKALAQGSIRIASANLTTDRVPRCPKAKLPVAVVFYKATPSAAGSDSVTLEVTEESGKSRTHTYAIKIESE